jgi:L-2,4-diaminobutyrate decarboxylase
MESALNPAFGEDTTEGMTLLPPDLAAARRRIEAAYDSELLRAAGHRLADLLSDHLCAVESGAGDVLPWRPPEENIRLATELIHGDCPDFREPAAQRVCTNGDRENGTVPLGDAGRQALLDRFSSLVQTMLAHGHNLHHPRYLGHQVPAPLPLAGLMDAVGAVTNQCMAIYDMGPFATAAEWAMIAELGQRIGWRPGTFAGLATHGGSLANLTALLTARNVVLGDSWSSGCWSSGFSRWDKDTDQVAPPKGGTPAPVLVVHADAHYSVARSAGILGLGTRQVVRVGLDERRRMDPQKLDDTLADLRRRAHTVVAVSACSCSTPVGAFDPLQDVVDVCRQHGVWLHVDAAHGGAACLSARHRALVAGLDRADSVTWDAHKMLFVPALCALVFYRDAAHRFAAFQQDATYLFDPAAPGIADYDSGLRTVECTKRAAVFGLWGAWAIFGPQLFADLVDVTFALGKTLYEKLSAAADFVPLHEPECNIVVFRYVPERLRNAPAEVLGRFQMDLRRRIIESGRFYIVSTHIDGIGALRVTIINPLTTAEHLDELLETIRRIGETTKQ